MTIAAAARPPKSCTDCALRRQPGFVPLSDEELACVQAFRSGQRSLRAGQALVPEHRVIDRLYTVYSGWAFRYKTLQDGRRQILNFLLPGDFVGLQGEFAQAATHGVEALTALQLCVFPPQGLWALYHEQPQLGYAITWLCATHEKLQDEILLTVGRRNAAERIAMLLIHLWRRAERVGLADADGSVPWPLTQQHIADALGLSLVHTNKTLRRLERLGLHELREGRLRLLHPEALARIADYHMRPMQPVPLI